MNPSGTTDQEALCGVWASPDGLVHQHLRTPSGEVRQVAEPFETFIWSREVPPGLREGTYRAELLSGSEPFRHLVFFRDPDAYRGVAGDREMGRMIEYQRLRENQFLLSCQRRLYGDLPFARLRRMQLDIETGCEERDGFSNPDRPNDRILAIGLRMGDEVELLELEEYSDVAECTLLKDFNRILADWDPDILEGHNVFDFDLWYLGRRSRRFRVPCQWGRFEQKGTFRKSRIRVAERWIDFMRCDIPGRAIFDTYLMIQLFDVTTRDLPSYRLKEVARYLGVTSPGAGARTYIDGSDIQVVFREERDRFRAYLEDDLRETRGIADILLPTYIAQVRSFPILLQEACLRGSASKVETLFLERYFHQRHALPDIPEARSYEGGYTRSFETGVYRKVLHYDVASLYPSLLLHIGRNPISDSLGVFIPLLREMRSYRLRYKELARTAETAELRQEYQARQTSFKILINSFYGYLGFPGARFGDSDLAAEVTARGRELLQQLIERFREENCTVLEADTDGIYVQSDQYWDQPERLLELACQGLPEGIDLEFDGRYESMFCYKAKNYALHDGEKMTIRGSALRSRGTEPILKDLTNHLLAYLLGVEEVSPTVLLDRFEREIREGKMPVERLARSEYLGMNPEVYRKKMEEGGKPRRASLEAAIQMKRPPKVGDQVSYYILAREKGQTSDWQRARPLEAFDPLAAPYDPVYYVKKLNDWLKRYAEFIPDTTEERQGRLL